ncbi:MAG TPA: ABC transporter ATP-binding protein [Dehalococcoidia bacterium]|nr:ABC transporter ATP-binding protein [Dehalococcoidia bacterium]
MGGILQVRGLTTQFFTRTGVVQAVSDVSFDVSQGETLGIVGESGCGKSVTAMSLMRIIPTPPGRIVAGSAVLQTDGGPIDLTTAGESELRRVRGREISMIFQDPMSSLNPVLTVGYQLLEPLKRHFRLSEEEARRRAIALLTAVGIPSAASRLGDYPHQFSGGMRQRVMVAMALICEPKLVIADEPTTALDVTIQAQLLDLIGALTREMGTAVILISHDLGVVAQTCRRIIVMYGGRVVESAAADDLFDRPSHPYTRGLLSSVPRLGRAVRERLVPIEGAPPDLISPPAGCRFRPRCPLAMTRCLEEPPLIPVAAGHQSRCWLAAS